MRPLTTTEQKALRLVRAGRVRIDRHEEAQVVGTVEGDSGLTYQVWIGAGGSSCTCPHGQHHTPAARCSHVIALTVAVEYGRDFEEASR
jgi:uncharacterized Zn finger protein